MDAVMPGLKVAPLAESPSLAPDSFEEIYEMYKGPVYRLACALADNAGDAEDLFQETWLRVVRFRRGGPVTGDLKSWLFAITANVHRDRLRKKRVRRLFFLERARSMAGRSADADAGWESAGFSIRDVAAERDLRLALRRAISRLPARQREVFVLKDVEGYKHSEIGRMLGIPEATVRTLLHRAVRRLQEDLAAYGPAEAQARRGPAASKETKL